MFNPKSDKMFDSMMPQSSRKKRKDPRSLNTTAVEHTVVCGVEHEHVAEHEHLIYIYIYVYM